MEEAFVYDNMDRLTEVGLNGVHSQVMTYDGYGRMTSKTAGGKSVFSNAVYNLTLKPHALDKVDKVRMGYDRTKCYVGGTYTY